VHHPLLYFPAFYCLKEVVNGGGIEGGLSKYSKNYQEDLVALWKLWVPSTIINFSLMPMHLRIPWVASTSLIWTCIISYMRGGNTETDPEQAMNIAAGNQGVALQGLYDLGISAKPAYAYNKQKDHVLMTATGRDRIGFISKIAATVSTQEGNILDVKAYKVGREFVTIMLVEIARGHIDPMRSELLRVHGSDTQFAFQNTQPWLSDTDSPRCKDGVQYTGVLRATGRDKPGILTNITTLLEELKLDVTSIECRQHMETTLDQETHQVFQISGVVRAFSPIDRKTLVQRLIAFEADHAEDSMRLGITETEPDPSFSAFQSSSTSKPQSLLARTITGQFTAGTQKGAS